MATENVAFLESFFNLIEAAYWIDDLITEHSEYDIKECEIRLVSSNLYRAGVSFEKNRDLFGATEDA